MTRRERLERKLEKRRQWAENAKKRADERFDTASAAVEGIPMGQPILIGHHSERRHRRALARCDANMRKACEESDKAKHHESNADGLEDLLTDTVFSDDPDAIDALQAKIEELEGEAGRANAINKAWRKSKGQPGWADGLDLSNDDRIKLEKTMAICPYLKGPCFTTNMRANIRRLKGRIGQIQIRNQRQAEAEAAGGLSIRHVERGYTLVRFAEKPERAILNDLKAAGYSWSNGQWQGKTENLPQSVKNLLENSTSGLTNDERTV